MYAKKIHRLHMTTPLWKAEPHIRILWFTILMYRDDRGFVDITPDHLHSASELTKDQFNDAFFFLTGMHDENRIDYVVQLENGFKINCLDKREKNKIDMMPDWKYKTKKGFEAYTRMTEDAYKEIMRDYNYLLELKNFYPNINISQSIQKAFSTYWGTENAWLKRRRRVANTINWKLTIANTLQYHLVKIPANTEDYELAYLIKMAENQNREKCHVTH